jgi:hypothetical protein
LLQLSIVQRLSAHRNQLAGDGPTRLDRYHASALAAAGHSAEAITIMQRLAEQFPRDGAIQEEHLRLLSQTNDRATLTRALAGWREMEKKTKRGSSRWFTARYAQAEALYRLGKSEDVAKLIELTRVLHPELGGDALRTKFEQLLKASNN